MGLLERTIKSWTDAGFPAVVVDAPPSAVTFDKMLVVYADPSHKTIRRVSLYNSIQGKFISEH